MSQRSAGVCVCVLLKMGRRYEALSVIKMGRRYEALSVIKKQNKNG